MKLSWPIALVTAVLSACGQAPYPFDAEQPARGPAQLLTARDAAGATWNEPASLAPTANPQAPALADDGALPTCDDDCRTYCANASLQNPVDAAVCRALWGVGLSTAAVVPSEACRRLYVDLWGIMPTLNEAQNSCTSRPLDVVAREMITDARFVHVQQRRWADALRYNNEAVSVERIYDADALVGMLYRGEVAYDEFAAVVSAHPVLTRRYDNAGDRAAALFALFLGRPPYDHERSDMARLYALWSNGYYDHPSLGLRLPDATIRYRCLTEDGAIDESNKGACTSVLWGYNELILRPDYRAEDGEMWSGLLTADEWSLLQEPGRILARLPAFWEYAADQVLQQYLGYDIATPVPEVRDALVDYVLSHDGDIRALHYAVVTSQLYLQSNRGPSATAHRHTYGPMKQVEVEPWIDTIKAVTGYDLARCDHRIADPNSLLRGQSVAALSLVESSDWAFDGEDIRFDYRNLARTLGGCPDNGIGGRFSTVSILTTATQEGFVARVCNPGMERGAGVASERLLPNGIQADTALSADIAQQIAAHQIGQYFGRAPAPEELTAARDGAAQCAPKPCSAETFARPLCYALLSSSEMLFY